MNTGWPQCFVIGWLFVALVTKLEDPKTSKNDFAMELVQTIVFIALLCWGGFWSRA